MSESTITEGSPSATPSGTFAIGGELRVTRLGFGSMQLGDDDNLESAILRADRALYVVKSSRHI